MTGKREEGKYRKPFREFVFIVVALLFPFRQSVVCWRDLFLLFCGKRDRKKLYFRKNRKKSCCRPWPWNFCQIFYHWTKMLFPNKNPFEKKCHKSIFPNKKAVTLRIVLLPMGLLHSTTWAPHFSRTIQGGGRREMVQSIYLTSLAVTTGEGGGGGGRNRQFYGRRKGGGAIFPSFSFLPWDKSRAVQRKEMSKEFYKGKLCLWYHDFPPCWMR